MGKNVNHELLVQRATLTIASQLWLKLVPANRVPIAWPKRSPGMTIDLGFAWLTLRAVPRVSIVDVPVSEALLRICWRVLVGIDAVAPVVAADEGVMRKLAEHLLPCSACLFHAVWALQG